jgi:hypothetical protein
VITVMPTYDLQTSRLDMALLRHLFFDFKGVIEVAGRGTD